MRPAMLVSIVVALGALALSGCAGGVTQTSSPEMPPVTGTAGRGADVGMSPAVTALVEQGRAQRRAGEYAQASATLERALRIESGEPQVWIEMGWLRFDEGNYAQAEQMGRRALSLAPAGSPAAAQAARLIAEAGSDPEP